MRTIIITMLLGGMLVAAKLGEMLVPTIYRHDNVIIISLSISEDISAIIEFSSYF